VKCPICGFWFWVEFSDIEKDQGGKNEFCIRCRWLLWIPIRGDPIPVPTPVICTNVLLKTNQKEVIYYAN
jgi:hypothetical protein